MCRVSMSAVIRNATIVPRRSSRIFFASQGKTISEYLFLRLRQRSKIKMVSQLRDEETPYHRWLGVSRQPSHGDGDGLGSLGNVLSASAQRPESPLLQTGFARH